MFEKNDKRRLYQLMDMYLSGVIAAPTFTDEFYFSYNLEIDDEMLKETERKAFQKLDEISSRFSEFEEDLKEYPGTYFSEAELRKKIIETKEKLKDEYTL